MVAVLVPGVAVAAMACASSPRQEETSSVGQAVTAPFWGPRRASRFSRIDRHQHRPPIVTGDLGVSPGSAVTGFPPGTVVGGTMQVATAVAAQAQADTTTAYNSLAGQACNTVLTGQDLGGLTLTTGTYCFSSSAQLTGTLTLDAQGDPAAVFVFQIGSTLTTASASVVRVINGGNPCNVYWQVGSSATLGTATTFVGSIVALTSISLTTGATVAGRALARNGAVTMDTNLVSTATCQTALDGGTADGGGTSSGASSSGTSSEASSSGNQLRGQQLRNQLRGQQLRNQLRGQQLRNQLRGQQLRNQLRGQQLRNQLRSQQLRNQQRRTWWKGRRGEDLLRHHVRRLRNRCEELRLVRQRLRFVGIVRERHVRQPEDGLQPLRLVRQRLQVLGVVRERRVLRERREHEQGRAPLREPPEGPAPDRAPSRSLKAEVAASAASER